MSWVRRLGRAERIVVVIALGVALDVFGQYFVPLTTFPFASTPSVVVPSFGPPGWFRVVVWFVLAGGWALGSIAILRAPPPE
jgi:hypothetical protein